MLALRIALGAVVAGAVTWSAGRQIAITGPVRRRNYRGIEVSSAGGVGVLLGFACGLAAIALVSQGSGAGPTVEHLVAFGVAAFGFGLLGLWDDLAGAAGERGWRAHVRAVRDRRATTGAVKLVGGTAVALVVSAGNSGGTAGLVLGGAVVALTANLFNMLDLRPGRSCKVFLVAGVPFIAGVLLFASDTSSVPGLAAALAAVAAFLPVDLRERAMIGDTGANAIGAIAGYALVTYATSAGARLVVVLVLSVVHLVGERPGLSAVIASFPPLRALDRAGRAPE